ncbi:stress-responsive transcription factor hsf1 [Modicella reniformis]|uniref:Stress-responsive transcription factor hsf1 n=1 Tax=Modicella reniformis TaxID=1440133 RepID=A0A9P6MHH5_9FUNG|nr:stress-responsive transcription factor hsf1 [Modicella reniformis]
MIFSTNGFIDPSNNDTSTSGSRIVELFSNSPLSGTLGILGANETTQPIITTPESDTLSFMSSPNNSSALTTPSDSSTLALINASQQQQQQSSDATMALLSSLGSPLNTTSSPAQVTDTTNNTSNGKASRSTSGTGITQIPSQSLQPLTRATNGARGNVAAFLTKLYNMVNGANSSELIKWSDDGQSFIVANHVEFAKEVLPKFFKHNNFSSFVRQLNMYGFHKVPHLQQGVLMPDSDSEQWEFSNQHFQRNQPDLLYLVSRKKASSGNEDKDALTMDLGHILQEVTAIKRHQVAISTDLKNIERDHQSLWQEANAARERHQRQQDTIDKILRFLASVFSGDKKRAIVPNKKARLTITDGEIDGTSNVDDVWGLLEEEEEDDDDKVDVLRGKRKRPTTSDGKEAVGGLIAPLIASELNPVSTVSSATSNINFSDHLTTLSANYPNIGNGTISNTFPSDFKFDPLNLTIPTGHMPNTLSPLHHDMLRSISMANARDTTQNPPPLPTLPPSLSQTSAGASVIKDVDQITQEMERLQRSIEALSQHGVIADHFDFDDDAYLSLADSYDLNGLGSLEHTYQGGFENDGSTNANASTSLSAVPSSLTTAIAMPYATTQGSFSFVDDLEDLLDMDPV